MDGHASTIEELAGGAQGRRSDADRCTSFASRLQTCEVGGRSGREGPPGLNCCHVRIWPAADPAVRYALRATPRSASSAVGPGLWVMSEGARADLGELVGGGGALVVPGLAGYAQVLVGAVVGG